MAEQQEQPDISPTDAEIVSRLAPYLKRIGWVRTVEERRPLDAKGRPTPWYTYAAIDFIGDRVRREFTVFEYGSGFSTLWWAKRVKRVICCEHDARWFAKLQTELPDNVTAIHRELVYGGDYSKEILNHGRMFDVVVVDGRDRVECAKHAVERLLDHGVIVWDNSDRKRYQEGYDFLLARGFRRLDFRGIGPMNTSGWMTSVFYRDNNCFGI